MDVLEEKEEAQLSVQLSRVPFMKSPPRGLQQVAKMN